MLHLHGSLETATQIYFIFLYRFCNLWYWVFFLEKEKKETKQNAVCTHIHTKKEIVILVGFAHPIPAYTFWCTRTACSFIQTCSVLYAYNGAKRSLDQISLQLASLNPDNPCLKEKTKFHRYLLPAAYYCD